MKKSALVLLAGLAFGSPSASGLPKSGSKSYSCRVLRGAYVQSKNLSDKLYAKSQELFQVQLDSIDRGLCYSCITRKVRQDISDMAIREFNDLNLNLDYVAVFGEGENTDVFKSNYDREIDEAFGCLEYEDYSGAALRAFFMKVEIKGHFQELVKDNVCSGDITTSKHK